jgi:hypothetical protein
VLDKGDLGWTIIKGEGEREREKWEKIIKK